MTLAGTILALHEGITLEALIAARVDSYANKECNRPNYSSGKTQASSSLRALEAFGIVKHDAKVSNNKCWNVANAERFARMVEAAQGISAASVTREQEASAIAESADSMTKAGRAASRRKGNGKGKSGKRASAPASVTEGDDSNGMGDDSGNAATPASDATNDASEGKEEIPAF